MDPILFLQRRLCTEVGQPLRDLGGLREAVGGGVRLMLRTEPLPFDDQLGFPRLVGREGGIQAVRLDASLAEGLGEFLHALPRRCRTTWRRPSSTRS